MINDDLKHPKVMHAKRLQEMQKTNLKHEKPLTHYNNQFLEWITNHVLASIVLFDIALIVPLITLPAPTSVKITLGVISGSWIQWWALPALQRSQNRTQAQNDAKADVDHRTLTYLATIQDEQLEILQELKKKIK